MPIITIGGAKLVKVLIINNLTAGLGDGAVFDFARVFAQDGDEICIRSTAGQSDLRSFLHDAENFDAVVAAGGDGTVASVTYALADTGIPILPYPCGTSNLLATNLSSPTEPHALAKQLRQMRTLDFDLGEITVGQNNKYGFTIMAGAGYDAIIMKAAETGKKMFGQMAYFASAFTNITPQFANFELTLDGKKVTSSGVGILLINFSKLQFDISVVHNNSPRDSMFDVVVLNTKDAIGLIPALFAAILDRSGEYPSRTDAFEIFQAHEVEITADPALPVQFDGEALDVSTPIHGRVLPQAARFIVSEECQALYS